MRRIVVSIQNGLLAETLTELLKKSDDFEPVRVAADENRRTISACAACRADIVLMEVSRAPGTTLDVRLEEVERLRALLPGCRTALLCDENVSPDIARDVAAAKKQGIVDAFCYSSVTCSYLLATLYAL